MTGEAVLREVSLTIPMAPDMEIAASKTATAIAEYMRMSADRIDEVRMAVVEACINAFEHSRSEDRNVYLHFAVLGDAAGDGVTTAPGTVQVDGTQPRRLQITIRDRGVGFSRESLEEPDITQKIKADRKRGWGLKIMEGLMDQVEVRSGSDGTTIVMQKGL